MSLYFVQHGMSLDKSVDEGRPLSEPGKQNTNKIANHLANQGLNIKQAFHSGKLRSVQTAHLFAKLFKIPKVQQHAFLNPNDDVKQLISLLEDDCMYVGHLPQLDKLVSRLVCGNENAGIVEFENAAVVCINRNEKGYHLDWMLIPSIL